MMRCRACGECSSFELIDLGTAPPSNSYVRAENLSDPEVFYPLKVKVCRNCWFTQTDFDVSQKELFSENYAYLSSYSSTWLAHVEEFVNEMIKRFKLTESSIVVEIASNDGCLLNFFKSASIPCYGIEPTESTSSIARSLGIEVIQEFFTKALADELSLAASRKADLLVANNVLAHVPDINDFVSGARALLKDDGVATFEFPHVLNLVKGTQFDTIYHEHFSYLSVLSLERVFEAHGLKIFDIERIQTHGGSLRCYVSRKESRKFSISSNVASTISEELASGLASEEFYSEFRGKALDVKVNLLRFLIDARINRRKVVGYGAAAKGNTLLNYCGIRSDLISWISDRNVKKCGLYTPGSRIQIKDFKDIFIERPDYVVIFPWNIKEEIVADLMPIKAWGGSIVTAIPKLEVQKL